MSKINPPPPPQIIINIDNQSVMETYLSKFFGVYIDKKLSWKTRISYMTGKIARRVGLLIKSMKYTLGKNGCYTPIEDNKTNVDRTFVFPLGWNWHDMDPWVFPTKSDITLGRHSMQGQVGSSSSETTV